MDRFNRRRLSKWLVGFATCMDVMSLSSVFSLPRYRPSVMSEGRSVGRSGPRGADPGAAIGCGSAGRRVAGRAGRGGVAAAARAKAVMQNESVMSVLCAAVLLECYVGNKRL